jgi:MoxR-like ATPase
MDENTHGFSEETDTNPMMDSETALDFSQTPEEITFVAEVAAKIRAEIQKVIIGQDEVITLMTAGLFSGGHLLLEGVPGVAKTLMVKLLAKTLNTGFKRIQFTPDLMPSDVIGTSVFNMQTSAFYFRQGPVFSNFILVDEINRAPAKTQAALFEAMEEHQVTVDGHTYPLTYPFFVVATQNPIEQEGTYKLPEAQLDRFIFRLEVGYPDLSEEEQILKRFSGDFSSNLSDTVNAVFDATHLKQCTDTIQKVHIREELLAYIARIVHDTRNNGSLFLGASTRASLAIMKTAKAYAAINSRGFVTPDDIKAVTYSVLNHRIILNPEREIEGVEVADVINEILANNEVPR